MKSVYCFLLAGVVAVSLSSCVVPVERTVIRDNDRHEHNDRGHDHDRDNDRDRRDGRDRRENSRDGRYNNNDRRDSSYKSTSTPSRDRRDDGVSLYIR